MGKCLRAATNSTCTVDMCAPEGLVCDCSGTAMCELYTCSTMQASSGIANSEFQVGDFVACESSTTYCLLIGDLFNAAETESLIPTPITSPPLALPSSSPFSEPLPSSSNMILSPSFSSKPSQSATESTSMRASATSSVTVIPSSSYFPIESSTPSTSTAPSPSSSFTASSSSFPSKVPSPTATSLFLFRNVQFGTENPLVNSFNLNAFVDLNSNLRKSSLSGQWADGLTQRRVITFRFYSDPLDIEKQMICAIYNPNTGSPDQFVEEISVKATISSGTFSSIEWTYCDDSDECQGSTSDTVLRSAHLSNSGESDGFCVGDLDNSSNYLSVTFTEVTGIQGIAFEEPSGVLRQYNWADMGLPEAGGLVGAWTSLEGNLVYFGVSPEIKFSWGGVPIPLS